MKKYWIVALLMLFIGASCVDDTSAYDTQQKEDVKVDNVKNEQGNTDEEELPEGKLVPGIHLVKLNVTQPDGQTVERRFKYFMPVSIDETKPISLIFEFHGSYEFDAGVTPSDPLKSITTSNALIQHAIQENCVICFPAGTAEMQEDGSGAVNWQYSEKHLPFVDAMIDYFKQRTPSIDTNRIYSTGQSSGAIFSFVLAFERSNVFAAITPRAGQMSLENQTVMPERAVPVRVFAGTDDNTVQHAAVIKNMTAWAEKIGGYFASDMEETKDAFEIEGYTKVDTRIWKGGKADLQIYSLQEQGHGISLGYCLPYMWEFMSTHTLDTQSGGLFVTSSLKEIEAECGETFSFDVKYTDGATFNMSQPKGWTLTVNDNKVTLKAPTDYYGAVARQGNITITASQDGKTITKEIPFTLKAPKNYFEVGDVYYNSKFEPVGVVCWVNEDNIKEAKIISLQEITTSDYKNGQFGDFGTFTTPDYDNGQENTRLHMEHNATLASPLDEESSGLVWAATYNYKGEDGWYLPAINELKAIHANIALIESKIKELGGDVFFRSGTQAYLSSTVTLSNESKCFHMFRFASGQEATQVRANTSYFYARAMKKVTK